MHQDSLTSGEKSRITRIRKRLLSWFDRCGRNFPWRRHEAGEYEKICVEVLLQRTRAETVAKCYNEFFRRYPDWDCLAAAPISELEMVLRPLGLWRRRARSISALAKYAHENGGTFPQQDKELADVPAVGQYVSNAIQLFQHDRAKPLVDVNMARFLERYLRSRRLADIRYDPWLQEACHWLVDCERPIATNWAALDHSALICTARSPRCSECELSARCNFALRQK
ncbi:hypothetical protein [Roseibium album]|uniref:Putative A/G-specific adenine glycosylase YfhQ n=1 Tax=Roseibium album TaxID=311410 RepID=A0A0M6ZL49_9HYPH|nr:putative A/G-specific adenine glycosylase YfhQ [Roseibium album]CTQ63669.1 putative A/G-specific adenine glycosylase YfhQ [Roseibium album]CTQ72195.1 putative A/G-specific adenine glycosylase YfhQ [Roseibium album]